MKLEQAARQALVALEDVMADFDGSWVLADTAITALRKALAEQATVSDGLCGRCEKKAADGWALYCVECWEQAEQEPVAVVEVTYGREPECYVTGNIDCFPEGEIPLYASPVRTKDLTDDEIYEFVCTTDSYKEFACAVIAAYREKNK